MTDIMPFIFQVGAPPCAGAFNKRDSKPTNFRKFYERGDFPIALEHDTKGNKIAWKVRNCKLIPILIRYYLVNYKSIFLKPGWLTFRKDCILLPVKI